MKRVLLMALVLGSVSTAAAQTSNTGAAECKLKLLQAPAIRGIHLGMTANDVLAVFPDAERAEMFRQKLSQERFGFIAADLIPSQSESKEKLVGVRSIDFGFLDGKLNFFSVTYNGPAWNSDEQFASKVAETLNLPGVESWTRKTQFGKKALGCDGFEISVEVGSENWGPSIKMRDLEKDVNNIVRDRGEAIKEKARQAFRP